ncbi:MAG: ferredoxin family protein [Planctomycetes bacterium]|nr:ferredoxin family protein [Planctomycetota bacterium]
MPHVVTARCVGCRYTDCAAVCPVDCFYHIEAKQMLVIDPDTCIDCDLCQEACPINAIWPDEEIPEPYKEWIDKNREMWKQGTNVTRQLEALPGAKTLAEIQAAERAKGLDIIEPPKSGS